MDPTFRTPQQFCMVALAVVAFAPSANAGIGVGAKPIAGAEVILDGTREMLDQKWTYWEGPRPTRTLGRLG